MLLQSYFSNLSNFNTYHDASNPDVHEGRGKDQEHTQEDAPEGQVQVEAQIEILFPVREGDPTGEVGQSVGHVLLTDPADVTDRAGDVPGRDHPVQVERHLGVGQTLRTGN